MIDEDQPSRNYLGALLARQNYSVQLVSSGREGYIIALRDRPEIIIFDTSLTDMPVIELVRKLRGDKRSAAAICIALAAASNSAQMNDMLAIGCSRFFLKTQESIDELVAFLAAPTQLQETQISQTKRAGGLLGVFLGAKGGMGTSSMCVNIAHNISTTFPDMDLAVMDLVFPIGSIASIVGQPADLDLMTATSLSPAGLSNEALCSTLKPLENWRFRFLSGAPEPETANSLDQTRFLGIARAFRQAFNFTLIDLGCSLSNVNLSIIQEADVVVIVTNTDLSTINLTRTILQYLQHKGVKPQRIYMLINRSMGLEGLSKSDAERILGIEIRATTPHLGGTFALANNQHLPILVKLPHDTATMLIKQISQEILETARRNRV